MMLKALLAALLAAGIGLSYYRHAAKVEGARADTEHDNRIKAQASVQLCNARTMLANDRAAALERESTNLRQARRIIEKEAQDEKARNEALSARLRREAAKTTETVECAAAPLPSSRLLDDAIRAANSPMSRPDR